MVNYAVIGVGYFGADLARIMNETENAKVTVVYDPDNGDEIAKELDCDHAPSLEAAVSRDDVDCVIVATPNYLHKEPVLLAAKHKKHVFCEKPIDHDVAKIKEVLDVVKETGMKYQVGFNRRFDHNFKAIQEAVKAGKVGKQQIIKITSRDPEPPSIDYVKVSGGIFLDMTIHDFDMVRYLSGAEVEEVYAEGSVTVDPEIGKAGDIDTAIITLKLSNGATAVIDNCRAACYGYDQRAEVFGTKGCVAISNDSDSNAVFSGKDGVVSEKPMFFFLERYMMAYANEIDSFVEAIVNGTPTPVNGEDGLAPVLIGLAAKKSVAEHRPVTIAEICKEHHI